MKVLFVGMYPDEVNRYRNVFFQNLIFAMADAGIDCTVISPIPITRYKRDVMKVSLTRIDVTPKGSKVEVYHPRYISLSAKKIGFLNTGIFTEALFQKSAFKCIKKIKKKFDVVYGHFFLSGGLTAIKIGRYYNLPTFVAYGECNYDTEITNLYRKLNQRDIEGLTGIIAVSTHNANILQEKTIFHNVPMIVAPNSVDMSLFYKRDKKSCRQELNIPLEKFIVGFVGGFVDRKGDKRLLEAVNKVDNVYVAFAGRGSQPPCGDKVIFCKALEHDQVPIFLNAVDVFCLPTLNEGSCNAIVEAAACGLPVISSDLPFNDDILTNENSIRINPNSVSEIYDAVVHLYSDEEFRNSIADRIRFDAQAFSIEERASNILRFINSMKNEMEEKSD